MMHSGGSTGTMTTLGSSTSRRIRLAEATRTWPLASWASLRRCFTSVSARRWSASRPSPSLAYELVIAARASALAVASRAIARRPVAALEVEVGLRDLQERVVGRGAKAGLIGSQDASAPPWV